MTRENTVNVPREPTDEMLKAWYDYRHNASGVVAWSAMIAAAPRHEDDWSELERLARAATPCEWAYADNAPVSYGSAWVNSPDVKNLAVCDGTRRSETHGFCLKMGEDENERNAAFIAAANPATILKLIASARSAPPPSVEVERLREALLNAVISLEELAAAWPEDSLPAGQVCVRMANAINNGNALLAALSRKQEPGVPTPGDWIEWSGGENPVPGEMVDTRFRGAPLSEGSSDPSAMWTWEHDGDDGDIIAYRIVPTPGGEGK